MAAMTFGSSPSSIPPISSKCTCPSKHGRVSCSNPLMANVKNENTTVGSSAAGNDSIPGCQLIGHNSAAGSRMESTMVALLNSTIFMPMEKECTYFFVLVLNSKVNSELKV